MLLRKHWEIFSPAQRMSFLSLNFLVRSGFSQHSSTALIFLTWADLAFVYDCRQNTDIIHSAKVKSQIHEPEETVG